MYKAAAIAGTPMGRLVTQPEIGQMVVRLCSSEFDFVTGQAIVVDGGLNDPPLSAARHLAGVIAIPDDGGAGERRADHEGRRPRRRI